MLQYFYWKLIDATYMISLRPHQVRGDVAMQQDELAMMRNVLDNHINSKEEDLFEMFYPS